MKKLFSNPEAEIIELSVKDILTASPDTIPGIDGDDEGVDFPGVDFPDVGQ